MPTMAKTRPSDAVDKQVFNVLGVLVEFLATPDEVGAETCLIRGTLPREVIVPLHSHAEPEMFYVLEGSLEVFRSNDGKTGWTTARVGEVVTIPGTIKHALRNSSSRAVALITVTQSGLYELFRELAKPFDPNQPAAPPTPEAMQQLFEAAAKYGYWLASPEENAAIGLPIG